MNKNVNATPKNHMRENLDIEKIHRVITLSSMIQGLELYSPLQFDDGQNLEEINLPPELYDALYINDEVKDVDICILGITILVLLLNFDIVRRIDVVYVFIFKQLYIVRPNNKSPPKTAIV